MTKKLVKGMAKTVRPLWHDNLLAHSQLPTCAMSYNVL